MNREGITVYTESVCGKCGLVDKREGADGGVPPVGWAQAIVSFRTPGSGWSGGAIHTKATLCPSCAVVVRDALLEQVDRRE